MLNMYASLKGLGDVGFFGALLGGGLLGRLESILGCLGAFWGCFGAPWALSRALLRRVGQRRPSEGRVATRDASLESQSSATIAQLGEHQTEDLEIPGLIPGLGIDSSS